MRHRSPGCSSPPRRWWPSVPRRSPPAPPRMAAAWATWISKQHRFETSKGRGSPRPFFFAAAASSRYSVLRRFTMRSLVHSRTINGHRKLANSAKADGSFDKALPPPGAAPSLVSDERQQVGVDGIGIRGRHAVREALVGLQRAVLEQL